MLTGVVGLIKWGHYTAAAINGYSVIRSKDGQVYSLTATVVQDDAFKMSMSPLTFIAKHAKGEWRFPIVSLVRMHQTVTAQMRPPQHVVHS